MHIAKYTGHKKKNNDKWWKPAHPNHVTAKKNEAMLPVMMPFLTENTYFHSLNFHILIQLCKTV